MNVMSKPLSNNQIDKLGERLKAGDPGDEDVTMLSAYRNSFAEAANLVADKVRELSGLPVAIRSLKTTLSIVAKLKRDGVKQLSAMQDIGGCRVTVTNLIEQDELTVKLMSAFPDAKLYDRVAKPSHGYRAKHLVVKVYGRRIEIQVRTIAQHCWAQMSEMTADAYGQNLKYGVIPATHYPTLEAAMQFLLNALLDSSEASADADRRGVAPDLLLALHEEMLQRSVKHYEQNKSIIAKAKEFKLL
jgi:ppGpp synthetase/RelA/SpoT-type nucleotidyltranferase